uniref:Uncharacterized protein n=1 Tax=Pseudo-nitzschia australis TaxID=44445 RepID=A0A7S4AUS3_9STRA|mmetsp:Transcript_19939/g.42114  ORF Transcript_19939/g.42114 Transcript_19939/m.42114 type:complete len:548 (-) Transcript_19939:496-2139(-)|eukprot:CAMPEP_0168183724 /NCGR_PEP_ID=MMETSP0139_2-20121125/12765_1 /TAXON_ID=44445 /ORGANISM="Pseudo-nitzschia australis, Strain 10249 10 AB" /LENGTH=547 /DNA_ID=CAMNT_0008105111 /DNA_START=112 /DNA_END=1755 /DNA_ORIENTATION=-
MKKRRNDDNNDNDTGSSENDKANTNSNNNDNNSAALSLCRQARKLWLQNATTPEDLDRVEALYRRALNAKRTVVVQATKKQKRERNASSKQANATKVVATLSPDEYRKAGERLSLLYLQSGRPYKATMGLKYLGFECRLSERILNYSLSTAKKKSNAKTRGGKKKNNSSSNTMPQPPCCVVDDFLSPVELQHLRKVFGDVSSSYWSCHDYTIDEEPPAPYFSYVLDLKSSSKDGSFLKSVVDKVLSCARVSERFRNLRRDANYVELWAHNRPHASGHQLHFDSDDEGRTRSGDDENSREQGLPKHPIVSTVLNLSSHSKVGGPTLVTNQRLAGNSNSNNSNTNTATTHLSSVRGWLVPSKPARLVCFDGSVLHGVIPGKGTIPTTTTGSSTSIHDDDDNDNNNDDDDESSSSQPPRDHHHRRPRRVTLMMAFWKDIKVRKGSKPGSARPWPKSAKAVDSTATNKTTTLPPWAIELNRTDIAGTSSKSKTTSKSLSKQQQWKDETESKVVPVHHVYELLDGRPVPKYHDEGDDDGYYMPEYDRVFQGF